MYDRDRLGKVEEKGKENSREEQEGEANEGAVQRPGRRDPEIGGAKVRKRTAKQE
jgi:hypothetical protein